jgi:hypothetical protein
MTITRRKILGFFPFLTVGLIPSAKAEQPTQEPSGTVLGHQLHDEVSVSLIETYARSLSLKDEDARWEAQIMFHEAQLARQRGGTLSHKLGYRHKELLEAYERGEEPARKGPVWGGSKSSELHAKLTQTKNKRPDI